MSVGSVRSVREGIFGFPLTNVIEPSSTWQRVDEGNKVREARDNVPKDKNLSFDDLVDILGHGFKVDDTAFARNSCGSR